VACEGWKDAGPQASGKTRGDIGPKKAPAKKVTAKKSRVKKKTRKSGVDGKSLKKESPKTGEVLGNLPPTSRSHCPGKCHPQLATVGGKKPFDDPQWVYEANGGDRAVEFVNDGRAREGSRNRNDQTGELPGDRAGHEFAAVENAIIDGGSGSGEREEEGRPPFSMRQQRNG